MWVQNKFYWELSWCVRQQKKKQSMRIRAEVAVKQQENELPLVQTVDRRDI